MSKLSYITDEKYNELLKEIISTIQSWGYCKEDVFYSDNKKEIETLIEEVVDDYIDLSDGFNNMQCDLGMYQRKELIIFLFEDVKKSY